MFVSKYFILFILYSCMGWIYESVFCTIKSHKWENRGFLYGPVCPIYGIGAVAISAIMGYIPYFKNVGYSWWHIFLISFLGSMLLEYATSWILETLFHAIWWDYSNVPLNINGRVCLPAACGFGAAGLLVVYIIAPFTEKMVDSLSVNSVEIISLLFMAFFAVDLTLTISALTNFTRNVVVLSESLNRYMDSLVLEVQEKTAEAGKRIAEERQRFTKDHTEKLFHTMHFHDKFAIQRVRDFKFKKLDIDGSKEFLFNIKKMIRK